MTEVDGKPWLQLHRIRQDNIRGHIRRRTRGARRAITLAHNGIR